MKKERFNPLNHGEEIRHVYLDKFARDCEHFLGKGNHDETLLWGGNVAEHLKMVRNLWNSLPEDVRPYWLTLEKIERFESLMAPQDSGSDFRAVIVNQIADKATGQVYPIGSRVRVLLKSESEYIGTLKSIFVNGFTLLAAGENETISLDDIDKMRFAEPGENFLNNWNF